MSQELRIIHALVAQTLDEFKNEVQDEDSIHDTLTFIDALLTGTDTVFLRDELEGLLEQDLFIHIRSDIQEVLRKYPK
jgi:hypothetical protein